MNDSIGWITTHLGISPTLRYTGGDRGWIGQPFIFRTLPGCGLGWRPKPTIREGIIRTLDYLRTNAWLLEERA